MTMSNYYDILIMDNSAGVEITNGSPSHSYSTVRIALALLLLPAEKKERQARPHYMRGIHTAISIAAGYGQPMLEGSSMSPYLNPQPFAKALAPCQMTF
jgi:hypothetical protein